MPPPDPSNLDFRHTSRLFVEVLRGKGSPLGSQKWPETGQGGHIIDTPLSAGAPRNHDFAREGLTFQTLSFSAPLSATIFALFQPSLPTMLPQTLQIAIFGTPALYLSRVCLARGTNLGPNSGPKSAQRGSPSAPLFTPEFPETTILHRRGP